MPNEVLRAMEIAARAGGSIVRKAFSEPNLLTISNKGAADFATDIDRASEKRIVETIEAQLGALKFTTEEAGTINETSLFEVEIIIDPIDGTNNFINSVPHFSISIAAETSSGYYAGVVYNPLTEEMFSAEKSAGAFCNGQRIKFKEKRHMSELLLASCLPYIGKGDIARALQHLGVILPQVSGVRIPGSAALEIAFVAAGRFDGFWASAAKLDYWDIAAGIAIAKEAGCTVTSLTGEDCTRDWNGILVTSPKWHSSILELLSE